MGATVVVPVCKIGELPVERGRAKWHQNDTHAFVLERQDESLDERNTPVLANSAKAGRDPVVVTPIFEQVAPELLAFVRHDVFRLSTCAIHGAFEKILNRS